MKIQLNLSDAETEEVKNYAIDNFQSPTQWVSQQVAIVLRHLRGREAKRVAEEDRLAQEEMRAYASPISQPTAPIIDNIIVKGTTNGAAIKVVSTHLIPQLSPVGGTMLETPTLWAKAEK